VSLISPFRALRPASGRAAEILAPPYDVLSSAEARIRAKGRPHSFLHISKPEIDLDPSVDPYSAVVYAKAAENLARMIERGGKGATVEHAASMTKDHDELIREFFNREKPNAWIQGLFKGLAAYAGRCGTSMVLNAWDKAGKLSAFYVLELGAAAFVTYVAGCHSKKHYVPQASDLLFFEMVEVAREEGKGTINLGLGVNRGIRRFKEKWGGVPFLKYEFCEYTTGFTRTTSLIKALESKL